MFFITLGSTLNWTYIKYAKNLKKMKRYAWSTSIKEYLISSLDQKFDKSETVNDCVPVLLVNIYSYHIFTFTKLRNVIVGKITDNTKFQIMISI